ncbi:MAG TPA: L,D-transpeptidase family protein [Gemmatimonadales bacterium]
MSTRFSRPEAYRHSTSRRALRRLLLAPLALAALAAAGCDRGDVREAEGMVAAEGWTPSAEAIGDIPVGEVTNALRARLESGRRPAGITDGQWRRVTELYGAYAQAPLFLEADGLADRARAMVATVAQAPDDGLSLASYPLAELRDALEAARGDATADQYAQADLLLTATYVALGEDLLTGQIAPSSVSQGWHIDPQEVDVDSALARTLRAARFDQALAAMRPQEGGYQELRRSYAQYRDLAARGGWPTVPGGETLKPGQKAPTARLLALGQRLRAEGYLAGDSGASGASATPRAVYDSALAGAVARFQRRHNIVVDSILGGQTLESLNLSAEYRATQIAANMERYRWLPNSMGSRYVIVNVPAFRLEAFEAGKPALTMNVVVGAEYEDRSTPTFSDSMSIVVFRPYWNVPDNIAEEEIYPKAAADPGYFAEKHYEEVTENGRTWVRQTPGDHNALGLVKFLFPNDFAIYLHDTPESELFKQDVRAASHGCIRVEHPEQLAQWVLGWDQARVRQAMYEGEDDHQIRLEHKIPVFIVYFTAYERDGELWWGNDVYARDTELVEKLRASATTPAEAARMVEELRKVMG